MYQVQRPPHNRTLPIRGLDYHVRTWGTRNPDQPPLLMVHGWMDIGASFQFMVDAMAQDRWVIAPDLRGFGNTKPAFADSFWFADYLADLDAILAHMVGDQPIDLLGHSLGGHVATTYAGVRPERAVIAAVFFEKAGASFTSVVMSLISGMRIAEMASQDG